jgi:hypothetical protein
MNACQTWNAYKVPLNNWSYQFPRTGNAYVFAQLFAPGAGAERGYLKNRLKSKLKAGRKYCLTAYLNSGHTPKYSINSVGIYAGGAELDTVSNPNLAQPNIVPQVELPFILYDTLNWIPLSGTMTATGEEKYVVVGCFKANGAVNFSTTNSGTFNIGWAGYNVDDVSCIELDENFAGRDTTILPGDSLFIGKTNDDSWLEAKFSWHKLPDSATIDTTGFWVKPVSTCSYVVKQEICSYTIWDTIVIRIKEDDTRIAEQRADFLKVFPMPAEDKLELKTEVPQWYEGLSQFLIVNGLGQEIIKEILDLSTGRFIIDVSELAGGVYTLTLFGRSEQKIVKRILISR